MHKAVLERSTERFSVRITALLLTTSVEDAQISHAQGDVIF